VGPDAGMSVSLSSLHAPDVPMFEPDVASGPSVKLTVPPAPDQIHSSTVERAFEPVNDLGSPPSGFESLALGW
jgi:hypothetical protein